MGVPLGLRKERRKNSTRERLQTYRVLGETGKLKGPPSPSSPLQFHYSPYTGYQCEKR